LIKEEGRDICYVGKGKMIIKKKKGKKKGEFIIRESLSISREKEKGRREKSTGKKRSTNKSRGAEKKTL